MALDGTNSQGQRIEAGDGDESTNVMKRVTSAQLSGGGSCSYVATSSTYCSGMMRKTERYGTMTTAIRDELPQELALSSRVTSVLDEDDAVEDHVGGAGSRGAPSGLPNRPSADTVCTSPVRVPDVQEAQR